MRPTGGGLEVLGLGKREKLPGAGEEEGMAWACVRFYVKFLCPADSTRHFLFQRKPWRFAQRRMMMIPEHQAKIK